MFLSIQDLGYTLLLFYLDIRTTSLLTYGLQYYSRNLPLDSWAFSLGLKVTPLAYLILKPSV
jgi:hypothetical protein